MKTLHKANLYCWSQFDEARNIDFHSYLWVRPEGNIAIDPLPLSYHDQEHLISTGQLTHILITNSDHIRAAVELSATTGAVIWGPEAEKESFMIDCSRWLGESKQVLNQLDVFCLQGSKTSGELAFLLEGDTLITGDLIRSHAGGTLCLLPDGKLNDRQLAIESVQKIASIKGLEAILTCDGWPVFRHGEQVLQELLHSLQT